MIRQLLTESLLLATGGAVGGLLVAAGGIRLLTLLLGNGDKDFPLPPVTNLSYLQTAKNGSLQQMFFELRTAGDPMALVNTVRQIVHRVSPRVPVADVRTQSQMIEQTIAQERTFAAFCTCFGLLALTRACVGLYATTAYAMIQRTYEIGIRMALGATKRRSLWMVVGEVLLAGAVGLAIGFGGLWEVTTSSSSSGAYRLTMRRRLEVPDQFWWRAPSSPPSCQLGGRRRSIRWSHCGMSSCAVPAV